MTETTNLGTQISDAANANAGTKVSEIPQLPENAKLHDVIKFVNEMIKSVPAKRDRGPESTREMTEEDARRVVLGDLKAEKHGVAAEKLGLSYGQVYSCRKGFTFKAIYQEGLKSGK